MTHKNLQVSVKLRNEVSLRKIANHGVNWLTVLEEDEGRDGDDAETSSKLLCHNEPPVTYGYKAINFLLLANLSPN